MKFINNIKNEPKKTWVFWTFLTVILIIGILVRIVGIGNMPNALNCDEASAGYEAFSILNYGIDRNGNFMPVFLIAWGSGQNALLSYMLIPFIQILGLNELAIRIPMAILGCISLILMYLLLKKISNKKLAILGLTFFAICPWHIMKSRWALESNLFPDLILIFTYFLVKGLEDKNNVLYYLAFVIAGISAYSYGTSYLFLPIFIIPLLIVLVKKQKITLKRAIISLIIVGIISMPIILMVIINTFNLPQINLPFMTIPKMEVNRFKVMTSVFSGEFFSKSINNFLDSIRILILQTDNLPWNSIEQFGTIYIFSTIFTIIGLIYAFKKEKTVEIKYNYIFNIWFIACIILTFICEPNINRLNIIMIPIIYYTIIGLYISLKFLIDKKVNVGAIVIAMVYLIIFVLFMKSYINEDCNTYSTFEGDLKEVIQYVDKIDGKQIYITDKIRASYIYVLFYSKYDTRDFVKTVEYERQDVEFRNVLGFGKYKFSDIQEIEDGNVYVINKKYRNDYNLENYKVTEFEKYLVIE